jgi:hypothetical protein
MPWLSSKKGRTLAIRPVDLLMPISAETRVTEGLLQNNFHHLLGSRDSLDDFTG